jgi:UDP-glucuronate 4-epimerase
MSRYLVTGGAGFVASHLAESLLEQGHEVVAIDAFTDYYARDLKEANVEQLRKHRCFDLIEGDLLETPIAGLIEAVDGVFHLAAQPGVRGSWGKTFAAYVRDNILASQLVFEATARAGVRVVWASSSSVYGNAEAYPTSEDVQPQPISPYGVTKLACEALARAYRTSMALDAVGLRYFTVYGPRQRPDMAFSRVTRALIDGRPFRVLGDGTQSRDVTYVGDAVSASVLAMEHGRSGTLYNVGGGSEVSLADVIALIQRLTGRDVDLRFEERAAGDVRRTSADTRAAQTDLGWVPAVALEAGLRAQLAWVGLLPD